MWGQTNLPPLYDACNISFQINNDYNAKVIALKAKFDKNFEKELLAATEQKLSQDNMGQQNAEVISSYKRVAQAQTA